MSSEKVSVEVEGRKLALSNLDKVLYPAAGFTKAQVIDYYQRIAPVLLPHIAKRPVTIKRYPDGVDGKFFFQKNAPAHRPTGSRRPGCRRPARPSRARRSSTSSAAICRR